MLWVMLASWPTVAPPVWLHSLGSFTADFGLPGALTTSLLAAEEGSPRPEEADEDSHKGENGAGHDDKSTSVESGSIIGVRSPRDQLLCMFENLTDRQAKQLLTYHGQKGSFLFVQQANRLTVHIRLGEDRRPGYSRHTILKDSKGSGYTLEESSAAYQSADDLIQSLARQYSAQGITLSPLFALSENSSSSPSTSFSAPPEYNIAQRHPNAPAKDLPTIRMFSRLHANVTNSLRYPTPSASGQFSMSSNYVTDHSPEHFHTCYYRLCHLDPEGHWWYPCKAGPAMCVLLTVVWIVLLLLFWWFALLVLLIIGGFLLAVTVCIYLQTGHWYCREVFCFDTLDDAESPA